MPPALQDDLDIVGNQPQGDGNEHKPFDNDENRFKLGIAIGLFLTDRLIKQRGQKQRKANDNQFSGVENRVHQNGLGIAPQRHEDFYYNEQDSRIQGYF